MVRGVGLDSIEIRRVEKAIERWGEAFLNRLFTPLEIDYCLSKRRAAQHFAARFAVKEAVMKSLGVRIGSVNWTDIGVENDSSGQPEINLSGRALEISEGLKVSKIYISITHNDSYGLAYAIAVG